MTIPVSCGGVHDLRAQRQADAHHWCVRMMARGIGGFGVSVALVPVFVTADDNWCIEAARGPKPVSVRLSPLPGYLTRRCTAITRTTNWHAMAASDTDDPANDPANRFRDPASLQMIPKMTPMTLQMIL